MNIFTLTIPVAPPISIFLLCIILILMLFGSFFMCIVLILGFFGILRIMPILDFINKIINAIWPDTMIRIADNIKKTFEVEGSTDTKGIYIFHPHGLLSISQAFHIGTNLTEWKNRKIYGIAHSNMWLLPFCKEILEQHNFCKSEYSVMKEKIEDGNSIGICLGGAREILYTEPGHIKLNISKKKGIFRMALETGTPLIPVLSYGENEIYKMVKTCGIKYFDSLQEFLVNNGLFVPSPSFESIMNWLSLIKRPLKNPIKTIVGNPLYVNKVEVPTDKEIIELRTKYFKALRELYKKTRPANYAEELIIV